MNKFIIRIFLLFLIFVAGIFLSFAEGPPGCADTTWTVCGSASGITSGYFIKDGVPITQVCMLVRPAAPYDLWYYLTDMQFVSITNSHNTYIYTENHRNTACTETSSVITISHDISASFPTNPIVSTLSPGTFNLVAKWEDPGSCPPVDPVYATLVVNIYKLGTTYTTIPDTPITPGNIGGSTYDNGTVFVIKKTTPMSIYSFMSAYNITVSGGSDNDKKITFITQGPCSTSTSTTNVADTVVTSTTGSLDLTTPAIYPITVTYYDLATAVGTTHDPSTTKQFYVCVWWVNLSLNCANGSSQYSTDSLKWPQIDKFGSETGRNLGMFIPTPQNGLTGFLTKEEIQGQIVPSGIGSNLSGFYFNQLLSSKEWKNIPPDTTYKCVTTISNDTDSPELDYQQDISRDDLIFMIDGVSYGPGDPVNGVTIKDRSNFTTWVTKDGIRCSDDLFWHVRFTIQGQNDDWIRIDPNDLATGQVSLDN